jgi:hypothetical protein
MFRNPCSLTQVNPCRVKSEGEGNPNIRGLGRQANTLHRHNIPPLFMDIRCSPNTLDNFSKFLAMTYLWSLWRTTLPSESFQLGLKFEGPMMWNLVPKYCYDFFSKATKFSSVEIALSLVTPRILPWPNPPLH